jgi:hypothetical protein
MVRRLSPEKQRQMIEFGRFWYSVGLSCQSANRPLFEESIFEIYRLEGFGEPRVIWCESPLQASRWHATLDEEYLGSFFGTFYGSLLQKDLQRAVGEPFGFCWLSPLDHVRWLSTIASIWGCLRSSLAKTGLDFVCHFGQLEAGWIGYCLFFERHMGVTYQRDSARRLHLVSQITRSAFWLWPYEKTVLVSERPRFILLDQQGLLHADGQKAIQWADGWGVYAWRGLPVRDCWGAVPSGRWDLKWLKEPGRGGERLLGAIVADIGFEPLVRDLGAEILDSEDDMELLEIAGLELEEPIVLLRVRCPSSGKKHLLRVPPYFTNCYAALQWTFGPEPIIFLKET